MTRNNGKLAIVTGAATGIGYELAKCCAEDGFDLLIAADEPEIQRAAEDFKRFGVQVDAVEADLATTKGVDTLYAATNGRPVDALLANAGIGLGGAFLTPGSFNATYNGTKAFIDSFSFALRNELKDTGVTVTCLMPGATETEFFERADMLDTKIGQSKKDDPSDVAKQGYEAMINGEGDVVTGFKNKVMSAAALLTSSDTLAEQHRKKAEPGSANN